MPKHEQGVTLDRYVVIPRCLVFISRGEEILLLRGAPHKRIWANQYNGIGGHLERGEDPKSTAQRELLEEAGLEGIDLWLCGVGVVDADDRIGIGMYIFRGEYNGATVRPSHEGTLEWLRIADISSYPLVEDLYVVLPRIIEMKRGADPLSFRSFYDESDHLRVIFA